MTAEQVEMVRRQGGFDAATPVLTLRDFAGLGGDIADPAGQEEHVFAATRDAVTHALGHALPRLLPGASPRDPASCAECVRERGGLVPTDRG